jgi:L-lactate dehydrogenase complex protein LldE
VLHVKEHLSGGDTALDIRRHIYELTEFLTDVLQVRSLSSYFPHRVGLHTGCHGQRGLHLSSMSERMLPQYSKPGQLLSLVEGLHLLYPARLDECCGFGGTFSVLEEAVSVRMGEDRIAEHEFNEVDYITSGDSSCLMHLEGILKRRGSKMKVIHISEILNSER